MKFILAIPMILLSATFAFAQDNTSPVGRWKTIDDETKLVKSIVEIREVDGNLEGSIQQLFRKPEEDQNPKCDKCKGDLKDKPIIGLKILNKMKKSGDHWSGGDILDPKNGKTYSCKIELIEDGKKLKVRGFIGFSLLGRTQVWERVEATAPTAEAAPAAADTAASPADSEQKSDAANAPAEPAEKKATKKKK